MPPMEHMCSMPRWFLLLATILCCTSSLRLAPRTPYAMRSMRSRQGRAALGMAADDGGGPFGNFFKTNRDTPEAIENQMRWGREQLDLEVPDATADGDAIANREDMIEKYIISEKEKFNRDIDRATAEREVDEWLLQQATNAAAKTSPTDVAAAVIVFFAAFASGLYFAAQNSSN